MNNPTHIQLCLNILVIAGDKWLHAYDFNSYGGIFIGHRGCARISDAQKKFPFLIEVKNDPNKPRLYIYRLKWEDLDSAMDRLRQVDHDSWLFIKNIMNDRGICFKVKKLVPEYQENGTVRMIEKFV